MSEHSPLPWQLCHHLRSAENDASCNCGYRGGIWDGTGETLVCEMRNCDLHEGHDMVRVGTREEQLANAALIVRAVNAHAQLVAALEKVAGLREYEATDHAEAAKYKPLEGLWTTDEYLADSVLASLKESA